MQKYGTKCPKHFCTDLSPNNLVFKEDVKVISYSTGASICGMRTWTKHHLKLFPLLSHLILTTTPMVHYYSQYTDGETETQRG